MPFPKLQYDEISMKTLLRALLLALTFTLVAAPATAQDKGAKVTAKKKSAKAKDIQKLIKLTGMKNMMSPFIDQMFTQVKAYYPDVPDKEWKRLRSKVDLDELTQQIGGVYDEEFTHKEIKEIIKFYETPTGKKTLTKMPIIMQKSQMLGQQWGMKVGQMIDSELRKKGYVK